MIMFFLRLQYCSSYWEPGQQLADVNLLIIYKVSENLRFTSPETAGCTYRCCCGRDFTAQMAQRLRQCPMPVQTLVVSGNNLINTGLETDDEAEQNTGAKLLIVIGIRGIPVKMN